MPLLLLFLALLLPLPAWADGALAKKIQDAYAKMDTFEGAFEQTLTHRESGSVEKRRGHLVFQKPLSIRWSTEKPNEELIVVNDKGIWDYIPAEEIAYVYPPDALAEANGIIPVFTGQARLQKDFEVKDGGKEKGLAKLTLLPREPSPQMVEATIWVDPKSGIIRRAAIKDFYGNGNDVRFTDFKIGGKVPASKFSFKAPAGVEVEDRRNQGM